MPDALLRIGVQPRDFPDMGRVDALVETVRIETPVARVEFEPPGIAPGPDRVEVEMIFGGAAESDPPSCPDDHRINRNSPSTAHLTSAHHMRRIRSSDFR